jgi:hypothetical protein
MTALAVVTGSAGESAEASKPTVPKWRDVLTVHPAAELFPLMSRDELIALAEDIKANGLQQPVTLKEISVPDPDDPDSFLRTGKYCVLDGRNRLDALEYLGRELFRPIRKGAHRHGLEIKVKGERFGPNYEFMSYGSFVDDEYSFVISANIHRRHLTAEQRRDLIAKVLKANPDQSNRQVAEQVKADDKTVAKVRKELEATAEIPQLEKTVGKDGKARKQTAKRAYKKVAQDAGHGSAEEARRQATIEAIADGECGDACLMQEAHTGDDSATVEDADHQEGLRVIVVRGFLNRAAEAKEIATIGKLQASDVTGEMIEAARQAVDAWKEIVERLVALKCAEDNPDTVAELVAEESATDDLIIPTFLRREAT